MMLVLCVGEGRKGKRGKAGTREVRVELWEEKRRCKVRDGHFPVLGNYLEVNHLFPDDYNGHE